MFILPIYYQVARGESALDAGLLLAPQGVGAALSMSLGGRLTDRVGPGRVVPIGLAVVVLGTIPYTQLGASTSYVLLGAALFVRGLGFGWTMMPAMAAAYRNLTRDHVPRATTSLNIVLRIGGSFGTALVAVLLERQISHRIPHGGSALLQGQPLPASVSGSAGGAQHHLAQALASSFGHTVWVLLAVTCVALVSSFFLPVGRAQAVRTVEP
jgi:predicted MFS family arabinose efflux permease